MARNQVMQTKKTNRPSPTKITIVTAPIQLLAAGAKVMKQAAEKQCEEEEDEESVDECNR